MRAFNETRTLPRPRPKVTVTFPRSSRPLARAVEVPERDQPSKDGLLRKCASADVGTALAPMSISAPMQASLARYEATLTLLRGRFPAIFGRARPLKIGIHLDLEAALAQEISRTTLRRFLARWTRQGAYREALAAGVRRIDLEGKDAGPALGQPAGLSVITKTQKV